jgi:DNA-binding NtrC family response regulator/predicted negative regulator of RcsB-dependent stress response
MNLASQLFRQVDDPSLNQAERAQLRCQFAKELEDSGNYEAARKAMGGFWQRIGDRPHLDGLDQHVTAEVLLRAGALSGWIGSANQIEGAQEIAKDLISESAALFETLQETEKVAEAHIDLAICYWREGAFDEARLTLREVLSRLGDKDSEQKGRALLNSAVVDIFSSRFNDALQTLTEAAPLFEKNQNESAKGRFHLNLAIVLKKLGAAEKREDYTDRALVEYAAASYHLEQAGNTRYRAIVENNLGYLLFARGKFTEAHEHLDRAHLLFASLKDSVHTAQVDDTRARVLLAQKRNSEAEKVVRLAVRTLDKGDEQSLLAEALTTHGVALARLGRYEESRLMLERAMEVSSQVGDSEGAGVAALSLIEELGERLTEEGTIALYERADQSLANSQNSETLVRLRLCARRVLDAGRARVKETAPPKFVYADEQTADLLRSAHNIASAAAPVLITGETGTGKELLARMIHEWSGRAGRFAVINCAAISETLIESFLFGHRKGSFIDAAQDSLGIVRHAVGGTLFLDEVAELSLANQGKLLRLIEHGETHVIGEPEPEQVDVRIVASTTRNLKELVAEKQFRDDLLYRLNTFHLELPPLRKRPNDISALAAHFVKELAEQHNQPVKFKLEAIEVMRGLPLMGNVRQLRSLIERAILKAGDRVEVTREAVEALVGWQTNQSPGDAWTGCSLEEEVLRYEASLIKLAFENARGSVTQAARLLGVTHQRLCSMVQGRHKNLLPAKKPAQRRKRSIFSK